MLKPVLRIIGHIGEVLDGVRWTKEIAVNKMCSAFWLAALHAHEADVLGPH